MIRKKRRRRVANKKAVAHRSFLRFANSLLIGVANTRKYYMENMILDGQLPIKKSINSRKIRTTEN